MASLLEFLAGLAVAGIAVAAGASKVKEAKDQARAWADKDGRDESDFGDYQASGEIRALDAKIKYFQQHGDSMSLEDLEDELNNYEQQFQLYQDKEEEARYDNDSYSQDLWREMAKRCQTIVKILDDKIRRYGR